jgi:tetratricopeptide (TPR) repeat protein
VAELFGPESQSLALQFLAFVSANADEKPSAELEAKAEAHRREAVAEWLRAEAAYRRSLALAGGNPAMVYKAHDELSSLYELLGRDADALAEAHLAANTARVTRMEPILAMAAEGLARCCIRAGDLACADAAVQEMLNASAGDRRFNLQRARALILRARCAVERGDLVTAAADIDAALSILSPQDGSGMMAGVQSAFANAWETRADLLTRRGDAQAAAMAEAVERRRIVAQALQLEGPYKHNALAMCLARYGFTLMAAGDVEGAKAAHAESAAIRARIGLAQLRGA